MLAYYEDGYHSPSPDTVLRLAHHLGVPESFFAAGALEEIPVDAVSFRALSKMTAGVRDGAIASGALAMELARWLDQRLHLPTPDVPRYELASRDPAGAAQRLRFEWDLGYAPIPNVVHLLEAHGVRVFSLPHRYEAVDAFSFWWQGQPIILLNTRKSGERGRFDAAHELGHLVIHADYDLPRGRERELEANRFAAALLMPEEDVLATSIRNADHRAVIRSKARWGVSAMALAHRLHELGITSEWTYASTCRRLSQLGYRSQEPDGRAREASQLLEKSFAALRARHMTLADVARDLHMYPEALRELIFGLAMTPVSGHGEASPRNNKDGLRLVQGGM